MQKSSNTKFTVTILILFLAIAAIVIYFGQLRKVNNAPAVIAQKNISIDGTYLSQPVAIKDFTLTSTTGTSFTKDNLKNHWTFMFFGFTNCGMVCPTTMAELNKMYKQLQNELPKDQLPQVVMVSVDPDRDSIERMKGYVTAFNPNFIGARAEMPQIKSMEGELHLVAVKMQSGNDKNQYTINHSAEIMVFNPQGELQAYLSYPHTGTTMAEDFKKMLVA